MEKIISKYEHEINDNAVEILNKLRIMDRVEINNIIGLYNDPELVEYSGDVYIASSSVPFEYSDDSEMNRILAAIESFNKKSKKYQLEFSYDDGEVVWCSVLWPIENWFMV